MTRFGSCGTTEGVESTHEILNLFLTCIQGIQHALQGPKQAGET